MPTRRADLIGRTLLALCAASTLVAFADGVLQLREAPDAWLLAQFWRTTGYLVFTGMWALLAISPRRQRGLWELIVLQKSLVTIYALLVLDKPFAVQTAVVDGLLVVVTVTAWVLCRGWLTWRRDEVSRPPAPGTTSPADLPEPRAVR